MKEVKKVEVRNRREGPVKGNIVLLPERVAERVSLDETVPRESVKVADKLGCAVEQSSVVNTVFVRTKVV